MIKPEAIEALFKAESFDDNYKSPTVINDPVLEKAAVETIKVENETKDIVDISSEPKNQNLKYINGLYVELTMNNILTSNNKISSTRRKEDFFFPVCFPAGGLPSG